MKASEGISEKQNREIEKLCSDYRKNLIRRFQGSDADGQSSKKPELLGLNALIAEHLHNHGYFISQSVFSSEIELPGTPTLLDQEQNYRLRQSDVAEIIGALNLSLKPEELSSLIECYTRDTQKSLLSTLLSKSSWKSKRKETTQRDLMAFNKYLKILVNRIAKVSIVLSELKRKRIELNKPKQVSPTKNRRQSRENNQIQDLAKKIERLSNKLSSIQTECYNGGHSRSPAKSYRDWLKELKSCRNGQRMLRRIEKIIVNSLNKEQLAMQKNFDEKLDTQKMILKLHYKQKFLEHFQTLNLSNEPVIKHPLKDMNGWGRRRKEQRKKSSSEDDQRLRKNKNNEKVLKCSEKEEGKENATKSNEEMAKVATIVLEDDKDRKIRLNKVEQLIRDAKDRIKLLQSENERLDQSFNTYLEKQSSQTILQTNVSAIWESYNMDRLLLQKRRHNGPDKLQTKFVGPEIRLEKCNLQVSAEIGLPNPVEKAGSGGNGTLAGGASSSGSIQVKDNSSAEEFTNPFINFDIKQFLESTTRPGPAAEQDERVEKSKSPE